jgi:ribosome-associated toxin RatA of RatAB toxin-antitoxin module
MAEADVKYTVNVSKDRFFRTICRYADYPDYVENCDRVTVENLGPGKANVTYEVTIMGKEIQYKLEHEEFPDKGLMTWRLVESNFVRRNIGRWEITEKGASQAEVRYVIDIEFLIPVPGFILNKLVRGSLPGMIRNFEEKARTL